MQNAKLIDKMMRWLIWGLIFITPLFFLPITTNFYSFNKNFLLYLGVGLLYLLWAVKITSEKQIKLRKTPFNLGVILFALSQLAALIMASPNKIEPLFFGVSAGTIFALTLFYFMLINHLPKNTLTAINISAIILSLLTAFQFITEITLPFAWANAKLWTPAGSPLALISLLIIVLVFNLNIFLKKLSQPNQPVNQLLVAFATHGLATIILCLGLVVTGLKIFPDQKTNPLFLPYLSGWQIGIEAFKNQPFWGVGPGGFINAFNRFRPISYNQFSFWPLRFENSSNFPLELLTISGGLGLVAFFWIALKGLKNKPRGLGRLSWGPWLASLIILLILPANFLNLWLFFILLAIISRYSSSQEKKTFLLPNMTSATFSGVILILVGIAFYFSSRIYLADIHFRRSLNALAQNQGLEAYNQQIKAIELSPKITSYHLIYSQTNLALAQSLSQQPDLSDQDKTQINQLIQQAIREARIATQLDPQNSEAWKNMGQIYRSLINSAEGADQWTIASLQQAINTDPVNPQLRLNLGGLFYSLGNLEAASRQFENAINLKSDYANAYYNLAVAYRDQEKYLMAYQAMQATINLLPPGSKDFQKAKEELDALAGKLPEPKPAPQTQPQPAEEKLIEPEPLPEPVIKEPIEIPEENIPEIPETEELTPTPTLIP